MRRANKTGLSPSVTTGIARMFCLFVPLTHSAPLPELGSRAGLCTGVLLLQSGDWSAISKARSHSVKAKVPGPKKPVTHRWGSRRCPGSHSATGQPPRGKAGTHYTLSTWLVVSPSETQRCSKGTDREFWPIFPLRGNSGAEGLRKHRSRGEPRGGQEWGKPRFVWEELWNDPRARLSRFDDFSFARIQLLSKQSSFPTNSRPRHVILHKFVHMKHRTSSPAESLRGVKRRPDEPALRSITLLKQERLGGSTPSCSLKGTRPARKMRRCGRKKKIRQRLPEADRRKKNEFLAMLGPGAANIRFRTSSNADSPKRPTWDEASREFFTPRSK